jgi:D-cysteine desulfhydrase family pyridoxal phosphate-dependent enzyme
MPSGALPGRIAHMPRLRLANLPTPLEEAERLSEALKGPRILFKRDDLTGIGLGGNKVRKLEFIIARALAEGADTLVVCGGYQSNLARISAAMANRAGLKVELVLGGLPDEPRPLVGNLLLGGLLGANVTYVETVPRWEFGDSIENVAETVRRRGGRPFIMPLGGSGPEGMAGYVCATSELAAQLQNADIRADRLVVGIGSGGTFSGLLLGAANIAVDYSVTGISVSRTVEYLQEAVPEIVGKGASALDLRIPSTADLDIHDAYIGDGYGALTPSCTQAIRLTARTEGVLLDPVYSGKAMAGLIDLIREGRIGSNETVIFLHTGGQPALFAYGASQLMGDPATSGIVEGRSL